MQQLQLPDADATEDFGRRLAAASQALGGGALITLEGDLGAGKTTLVRGFLRGYGFTGPVKSPTYTLVEPYELPGCNIYHFDLYRISDPGEMEFLGVAEYLSGSHLCLVEWPERGLGALPPADLSLRLADSGTGRSLSWTSHSPVGARLSERILNPGRKA